MDYYCPSSPSSSTATQRIENYTIGNNNRQHHHHYGEDSINVNIRYGGGYGSEPLTKTREPNKLPRRPSFGQTSLKEIGNNINNNDYSPASYFEYNNNNYNNENVNGRSRGFEDEEDDDGYNNNSHHHRQHHHHRNTQLSQQQQRQNAAHQHHHHQHQVNGRRRGFEDRKDNHGYNNNSHLHRQNQHHRHRNTQSPQQQQQQQQHAAHQQQPHHHHHQQQQATNNQNRTSRRRGLEEDCDDRDNNNNSSISSSSNRRRSIPRRPSFGQTALPNGIESRTGDNKQPIDKNYYNVGDAPSTPRKHTATTTAAAPVITPYYHHSDNNDAPSTPKQQQHNHNQTAGSMSSITTPVRDNRKNITNEQQSSAPTSPMISISSSQTTPTMNNRTKEIYDNTTSHGGQHDDDSLPPYLPHQHQQTQTRQQLCLLQPTLSLGSTTKPREPEPLYVPSLTTNRTNNNNKTVRVKRHVDTTTNNPLSTSKKKNDTDNEYDDKISKLQQGMMLIDDDSYNDDTKAQEKKDKAVKATARTKFFMNKYAKKVADNDDANKKRKKNEKEDKKKLELAKGTASPDDNTTKDKKMNNKKKRFNFNKKKKKGGDENVMDDDDYDYYDDGSPAEVFEDYDDNDDEFVMPGAIAVKDGNGQYRNKRRGIGEAEQPSSFYSVNAATSTAAVADQLRSGQETTLCQDQLQIPSMFAQQHQLGNDDGGPEVINNINDCMRDGSTEMIAPLQASLAPADRPPRRIIYQPQPQPPSHNSPSDIETGQRRSEAKVAKNTQKWYCSKRFSIIIVSILIVIGIAVGVTVPLMMSSASSDDDSSGGSGTTSSPSPTLSPTKVDTDEINFVKRKETIITLLTPDVTSNVTLFDNNVFDNGKRTPQSLALEWIVYNDTTYSIDPLSATENTNNARLIQRYVLALFYYSTKGSNWLLQYNWLDTTMNECQWTYISCNALEHVIGIEIHDRNKLVGPIPSEISSLASLQTLIINKNSITFLPVELHSLRNTLTTLQFEENSNKNNDNVDSGSLNSNSTIPAIIYELTNLEQLILTDSNLLGTISSKISQLRNLRDLRLGGRSNQLHGTIPTELYDNPTSFTNLQTISFGGNFMNLQGNLTSILIGLASNVALATNLNTFDVYGNDLQSFIPKEIGELKGLSMLHLDDNEISGTIPSEIALATDLTHLYLNKNKLVGTVPSDIGNLVHLEQFWFGHNELTGSVPEEICTNIDAFNPEKRATGSSSLESDPPLVRDCNVECSDMNCCDRCNG